MTKRSKRLLMCLIALLLASGTGLVYWAFFIGLVFGGMHPRGGAWSPDSSTFAYLSSDTWVTLRPHGPWSKSIVYVHWFTAADPSNERSLSIVECDPPEPVDALIPAHAVRLAFMDDNRTLAVKTPDRHLLIDVIAGTLREIPEEEYNGLALTTPPESDLYFGSAPSPDGRMAAYYDKGTKRITLRKTGAAP